MALTCKILGCNNLVFGGSVCKYHQYERHKRGGDLYQKKPPKPRSPKRQDKPPLESKKRKKEHIYYSKGCKQLEQEQREQNNGKVFDFFTGLEIKGQVTWHHLLGRTGDFYLDKDLLVPAENDENDGHLFWHRATLDQLKEKKWYPEFLIRLKAKSLQAYEKEMRKYQKNINLFAEDEDNDYI
jgi:hypothetical protein